VVAHIISPNVIPLELVHLQIHLIDNYPPLGQLQTSSTSPIQPPLVHQTHNLYQHFIEASTSAAAPGLIIPTAMHANSVQDHTRNTIAPPYLWGSLLPTLDKWGVCTPLRPLILECELINHLDKAFVKLLLSDITQGCDISYTGPQFASTARNL